MADCAFLSGLLTYKLGSQPRFPSFWGAPTYAELQVTCYTDSKSLYDNLQSSKIIQDLRVRVDVARIREMVHLNEIEVVWVDKSKQLSDPLTKAGASTTRLLEVLRSGEIVT